MCCFRAWEDWAVYPNDFLISLQNIFLGLVMSKVRLTYKPFLIYKGKYFWLVLLATCLGTVDACTCVQTEKMYSYLAISK